MKLFEASQVFLIDKERLKRSFSRQAWLYNHHATLQHQTGRDLLKLLKQRNIKPGKILDIGMGTAWLTQCLSGIYPGSFIVGFDLAWGMVNFAQRRHDFRFLQADAEKLPFKKESFDLAVANLVYQWVNDLETAFDQLCFILIPGGQFTFTILGPETLKELHTAYLKTHQRLGIWPYRHGQRFLSSEEIISILRKAGFSCIEVQIKKTRQLFNNVIELCRTLKNIGASNALSCRPTGLGGRLLFQEMTKYYQQYYSSGQGIYATFEILTMNAVKRQV